MSKYVITVTELFADPTGATISTAELFKQSVDSIDLNRLFVAINLKPRAPRKPKANRNSIDTGNGQK